MARIASQSAMGFYPFPIDELNLLLKKIDVEPDKFYNVYDPCCGEGEALALIAHSIRKKGADVKSYGVELDKERAEKAEKVLDYCLHTGYQSVRTENKMSLMLLNPPYDDIPDGVMDKRLESQFLRQLSYRAIGRHSALQDGGLLLYVVPQFVLEDSAGILATRFTNLKVYRFTDSNYDRFKQVVVLGYFRTPDNDERKQALAYLKEVARQGKETLPTLAELAEDNDVTFVLPSSEHVSFFRAGAFDDRELNKDLLDSPLIAKTKNVLAESSFKMNFNRPPLELGAVHYSLAVMANTDKGGLMGDHILVSKVTKKKSVNDYKEVDEESGEEEIKGEEIIEEFVSEFLVYTQEGVFELK